ncbi:MAG: hypothetical protein DI564_05315 [Rhodanobacter denitrificans]|uniref:Uncharacterized protein n=1 Tax=Rhodanobacter denitrificans TaxID=666685 RepID=A0A2W5KNS1_9GAMM|nr:MAG: hypothetical protein DI564_05315 [Rhodanobacter denitrificans]
MLLTRTLLGLAWGLAAGAAAAQDVVFADGFEPVTAMRMSDLALRDPHVYVNAIFSCADVTDTPLLGFSLNGTIRARIQTDEDGDGWLDANFLQLYRPLTAGGSGPVAVTGGVCTAPMATTTCLRDPALTPQPRWYTTATSGTCLAAEPGSVRPYSPAVAAVDAPCLLSSTQEMMLDLGGIAIPARASTFAGRFSGTPAVPAEGLLSAFVREVDAEAVLLPADLPLIGGQPLSSLLPGGTGNCAGHDDRDILNGERGWWFHLNYSAAAVPWSEP